MTTRATIDHMIYLVGPRATVLELGSGPGTAELLKHFRVISVEDFEPFVGIHHREYIHAPIKGLHVEGFEGLSWYDPLVLKKNLPSSYDLIYVDGPKATFGRVGFLTHLDLFRHDVPIMFDDAQRDRERQIMYAVAAKLGRSCYTKSAGDPNWPKRAFGVVPLKEVRDA